MFFPSRQGSGGRDLKRNRMYAYSKEASGKFLSSDSSPHLNSAWNVFNSDWTQTRDTFHQSEPGWKCWFLTTTYKCHKVMRLPPSAFTKNMTSLLKAEDLLWQMCYGNNHDSNDNFHFHRICTLWKKKKL